MRSNENLVGRGIVPGAAAPAEVVVVSPVVVGDLLIDENTGEILGLAPRRERFSVHDRDSAEWVVGKILDARLQAEAVKRRLAVLKENLESQIRDAEREADWFEYRFSSELETWARSQLGRSRTVKLDHGRLSFRRKEGRFKVDDPAKAIAWAKASGWSDAVKVEETLLISKVPTDKLDAKEPPAGFAYEPESESFAVKVDVG